MLLLQAALHKYENTLAPDFIPSRIDASWSPSTGLYKKSRSSSLWISFPVLAPGTALDIAQHSQSSSNIGDVVLFSKEAQTLFYVSNCTRQITLCQGNLSQVQLFHRNGGPIA